MREPDARWRGLRTAGPWALDGLLAVVAAGIGVATLATVLPFDPDSPRALPGRGQPAGGGGTSMIAERFGNPRGCPGDQDPGGGRSGA